jgi:hypothetical protein
VCLLGLPVSSKWAYLVTESCPEFESLTVNIMAGPNKRMYVLVMTYCENYFKIMNVVVDSAMNIETVENH